MKSLLEKSTGGVALGRCSLRLVWWIAMCQCLAGCHDGIELPSASRLLEFEAAGPSGPAVDMERLVKAKIPMGPYHVNFGDVLQLVLPPTLYPDVAPGPTGRGLTHICRVDDAGLVTLPDGRLIPVGGHTLTEIEAAIVKTYYPDLVKKRPAVYASVHEYSIQRVRILGAVARPGVYSLRPDQMSLVALLMEAGGVVETGAAAIRIISPRASTAKVAGHHALSGRGSVGTKRSVRAGLANLSPEIRNQSARPTALPGCRRSSRDGHAPMARHCKQAAKAGGLGQVGENVQPASGRGC